MNCAYCRDELAVAATCVQCQTAMHYECWEEHPDCPTLGCEVRVRKPWPPWIFGLIFESVILFFSLVAGGMNRRDYTNYYGSGQVASKSVKPPWKTVKVDCVLVGDHETTRVWSTYDSAQDCEPSVEDVQKGLSTEKKVNLEDLYVRYRHKINEDTLREQKRRSSTIKYSKLLPSGFEQLKFQFLNWFVDGIESRWASRPPNGIATSDVVPCRRRAIGLKNWVWPKWDLRGSVARWKLNAWNLSCRMRDRLRLNRWVSRMALWIFQKFG